MPGVDPKPPGVDPKPPGVDPRPPGVDPKPPGVDPRLPGEVPGVLPSWLAGVPGDPLSGLGIEAALESARLGAGALLEIMKGRSASARFAEYEDAVRGYAERHGKMANYHYGRL